MSKPSYFFIEGTVGKISAKIIKPKRKRYPLVIFMHGFEADKDCLDFFQTISTRLETYGIGSLLFDFNGHGHSDGKFEDMTLYSQIQDAMSVIGWANTQPEVESIGLLGHSLGGVIASMVMGLASAVKCVTLMAPASSMRDNCLRGNLLGTIFDPWHLPPHVDLPDGYRLSRAFIQEMMFLPIYETVTDYLEPVLILQGLNDRMVPYTYARNYDNALDDCELDLIPGADHLFSKHVHYVTERTSKWFAEIFFGREDDDDFDLDNLVDI